MSNISSNTVFHFTDTLDNLIGILQDDFHPRFSLESISFCDNDYSEHALPMVCFCDIPLSMVGGHLQTYGYYGIGMTKKWAHNQGINPVLYIPKDSALARSYHNLSISIGELYDKIEPELEREHQLLLEKELTGRGLLRTGKNPSRSDLEELWTKITDTNSNNTKILNLLFESIHLMYYMKQYIGDLNRKGKIFNNVRFYDEREWRFVAKSIPLLEHGILTKSEFENIEVREEANKRFAKYKLTFTPDDINYIILENDHQVSDMIDTIFYIKGKKFDPKQVEILKTKIISWERLKGDV